MLLVGITSVFYLWYLIFWLLRTFSSENRSSNSQLLYASWSLKGDINRNSVRIVIYNKRIVLFIAYSCANWFSFIGWMEIKCLVKCVLHFLEMLASFIESICSQNLVFVIPKIENVVVNDVLTGFRQIRFNKDFTTATDLIKT